MYSICWHIFFNGSGQFRECLCEVRGERSGLKEWMLEDWFIWGWCKYRGMEAHIPSVLGQHLLLCTSVVSCCVLGRDRKSVYLDVNIIYLLCVHIYSNISSLLRVNNLRGLLMRQTFPLLFFKLYKYINIYIYMKSF